MEIFMKEIEKIDKNFKVVEDVGEEITFVNCLTEPIRVYGLLSTEEGFARMPEKTARDISEGVAFLCHHTAGGRVRFRTDSPAIAIRAKMSDIGKMPHFALTGSAGFDLYEGGCYRGTFVPPFAIEDGYTSTIGLPGGRKMREITIHMPLYSGVKSLEIGLQAGAVIERARDYAIQDPVVYYGSSITQGGCASRPGNCYENIISRELDCDHVNLGFSGSALGEERMAEYIEGIKMSAFVYDYDHNAPDVAHLKKTHERMFEIIRRSHPTLPVVMVTRPQPNPNEKEQERRAVIMETYQSALNAGDKNVFFIDGSAMLHMFGGDCGTVDGCHPNDLGFQCMAKAIGSVLKNILE